MVGFVVLDPLIQKVGGSQGQDDGARVVKQSALVLRQENSLKPKSKFKVRRAWALDEVRPSGQQTVKPECTP